jgi:hypothetical protein
MRTWVPRRPGEQWRKLLHELEQLRLPTRFCPSRTIGVQTAGATAISTRNDFFGAVTKVPMRAGRHYAEFTLLYGGWPGTWRDEDGLGEISGTGMGVAGGAFVPGVASVDNFTYKNGHQNGRPLHACSNSEHGWMFQASDDGNGQGGMLGHGLSPTMPMNGYDLLEWPGMPQLPPHELGGNDRLNDGDIVGLLLDIDEGSLAVYLNGKRCGLMMQRGGRFKNRSLGIPAELQSPMRWAVDVGYEASIHIESKPPPVVTDDDRAEDERKAAGLLKRSTRLR